MRSLLSHSDVPSAQSVNGSLPLSDGGASATVTAPAADATAVNFKTLCTLCAAGRFRFKSAVRKAGQPLSVFPDAPTIQDPIRTSSLGQMTDIVEH
jgi:hypothetical protein